MLLITHQNGHSIANWATTWRTVLYPETHRPLLNSKPKMCSFVLAQWAFLHIESHGTGCACVCVCVCMCVWGGTKQYQMVPGFRITSVEQKHIFSWEVTDTLEFPAGCSALHNVHALPCMVPCRDFSVFCPNPPSLFGAGYRWQEVKTRIA